MPSLLSKVFGTKNDREIKRLQPLVQAINALEPEIKALSDDQLRGKTEEFRRRVQDVVAPLSEAAERDAAEKEVLDELLVPAFAVVREAGRRVLNMRHFDVQLIGGMVLHSGKIAEMKTGEGKTLVATLPAYLNALTGRGVHVVTVNDYLARRDSEWMGRLYRFLGMTVGVILHDLSDAERKAAYACDITYGTNNEFGFDYLRDNMKFELADCVQREHHYGIVDEVDSILIDEARTPLIISGPSEESTDKYYRIDHIIPRLERGDPPEGTEKPATGDYFIDEKMRTATLTEEGVVRGRGDAGGGEPLRPRQHGPDSPCLSGTARPYPVQARCRLHGEGGARPADGRKVVIVDEFTGRLMPGRRWSDGLHQAVEAKEGVQNRARKPDAGHHHLPELLPHVQEAVRHDRYGRDRGHRVPRDLQTRSGGDSDQPDADPPRIPGRRVPHRAGEVQRGGGGDHELHGEGPAGAGRHHLDREVRAAERAAEEGQGCRTSC